MCKPLVAPTKLENQILVTPVRRKTMKKVTFARTAKHDWDKAQVSMDIKVADDCVVIAGNFCPVTIDLNELIREVKVAGKDKVVIVGDCHTERDHRVANFGEKVINTFAMAGIECKWLEGLYLHNVESGFSDTHINTFDEAESFRKLRRMLQNMETKVSEVKRRIGVDARVLSEYPVVTKVQAIESHDHNKEYVVGSGVSAFNVLFGQRPDTLVSEVNTVVLLNLEEKSGLIVTKSQHIKFTFAQPIDPNTLYGIGEEGKEWKKRGYTRDGCGSIRVNVGKGSTELSIYCHPGVWTVQPHPELDTTNPDVRYVPMWQRVEQVK